MRFFLEKENKSKETVGTIARVTVGLEKPRIEAEAVKAKQAAGGAKSKSRDIPNQR
ncbi:MAG: hypothetical protein ACH344_06025 [Yersinia sp. (in: enterobacteria)]